MRKLVLLVSNLEAGGTERVAATLADLWSSRGNQVTLIPTYSRGKERSFFPISTDVETIFLSSMVERKSRVLGYAKRLDALRQLLRLKQPDIVVSFLPNVNIMGLLACCSIKIPLIACERRDPKTMPCSAGWELACRLLYPQAAALTVQTEAAAVTVRQCYPRLKHVAVLPNAISHPFCATEKLVQKKEAKVLLSMGRLADGKQTDVAVAAFSRLATQKRFLSWTMHIYGSGPLEAALRRQVALLGLEERILFKGLTPEPWLAMAAADAFIFTSASEGFPNVLLEAMAVGLPCIALDCPNGPFELSRGGQTALLSKLGDMASLTENLERIMSDESLQQQLGAYARRSVLQRYSQETVLRDWDALFQHVLKKRPSSARGGEHS